MRTLPFLLAAFLACEQPEPRTAPEPQRADATGAADSSPDPDGDASPRRNADTAPDPDASTPASTTSWLERYDFDERLWYVDLPGRLDEVSGLAFSPDGRLFAHDDERGRIHEIDPATGEVGKRFDLGEDLVRDDFEGIAIVGERFFLVSSTGWLYETREGADRDAVGYRVTDSGVGHSCEVEGLDHDPTTDELLIACKVTLPDRGEIVIHRIPVQPDRPRPQPVRVPKAALVAVGLRAEFDPSAIAVSPTGSWLLLSGRNDALLEITPSGEVLFGVGLRGGRHPQSEGLAVGPDGVLYVSDEKNGKEPRLTAYGPR